MLETLPSKSINLIQSDNFDIRLEYNKDFLIIHFPRMVKLDRNTLMELKFKLEDYSELFSTLGHEYLWAAVEPDSIMSKLATNLGFIQAGHHSDMDIYYYRREL